MKLYKKNIVRRHYEKLSMNGLKKVYVKVYNSKIQK